jgi:quinol monooxygenase YgiN
MMLKRTVVFLVATAAAVTVVFGQNGEQAPPAHPDEAKRMHGLIGKMTAVEGQRDALIEILLEGMNEMPGCLSYVVAKDPADANAIWITEVWDGPSSHQASLSLPNVQQAIARGKPLIAGFGERVVTEPVGGHGLAPPTGR